MKVAELANWLNALAPFDSAEDFDNVGLLMGDPDTEVTGVLFGMDVTEAMAREAESFGAELLITHHPFIFHGLKRIDYTGPQGRALCALAARGVSVMAAHTNWDKAPGGVGDALASALGLRDVVRADDYVRVGCLPTPLPADALHSLIRGALRVDARMYGAANGLIERVAVAGGAYGEGYAVAAAHGAQAYVVGEIAHHQALDACARGMLALDAGHYATELPGVVALYQRFLADAKTGGWHVQARLHTKAPYAGAILAL